METSAGSAARVGFVIFLATLVVIAAVYMVGDGGGFFEEYRSFYAYFPSASGLRTDARVNLSGVLVGKVAEIGFPKNLEEQEILVTLMVRSKFADRIRVDSLAWIESQGLLGDKLVSIMAGNPSEPKLEPGSAIRTGDQSLIEIIVGKKLASDTSTLLQNIITLLSDVNSGKGTLGQLLKSPELYTNINTLTVSLSKASDELASIETEVRKIVGDIQAQKGTLGRLISSEDYDREFAHMVRSMNALIDGLEKVVEPIGKGEGSLGKIVREDGLHRGVEEALAKLNSIAGRLDRNLRVMEENRSVLERLALDPSLGEKFERLLTNTERGTELAEKILGKVDQGEGSIGLLINDPSIAMSLRDIFMGVQDKPYLMALVQRTEEVGRAIRLRSERVALEKGRDELPRTAPDAAPREMEGKPMPASLKENEGGGKVESGIIEKVQDGK